MTKISFLEVFHRELAVAMPIVGVAFPSLLLCIFEVHITNIDLLGHLEDSGGFLDMLELGYRAPLSWIAINNTRFKIGMIILS